MHKFIVPALLLLTANAFAQDTQQRQIRALPHLMEQINALNGNLAVCQGDVDGLQAQIADANKKLAEATAELAKLKETSK